MTTSPEYMEAFREVQVLFDLNAPERQALGISEYYDEILQAMISRDFDRVRVYLHAAGLREIPSASIAGITEFELLQTRWKPFRSVIDRD